MSAWDSPIITVSTGRLNTVNETIIGGQATLGTRSRFAGQLGKTVWFDSQQILNMYDPTIGTLYAGRYRYVRRRSADDNSPALGVGKLVFWDTTVTGGLTKYQVTSDEDLSSSSNAVFMAGVAICDIDPGSYGFICDMGLVYCRYRSVLTIGAAVGQAVYASGAGDTGSDQGTVDNLTTDATSIPNQRYLGTAVELPVAAGLKLVFLNMKNTLFP